MNTLFTVWGVGALALAGSIHFAHMPEQQAAHGRSLAKAAAQVADFKAKQAVRAPLVVAPVTLPSHITQVALSEPKVKKPKTHKLTKRKAKKNWSKANKRKHKNPVVSSLRKVDRFLKRAF